MFRSLPEDVRGSYLNSCLPLKMKGLIAWENDARLGVAGPIIVDGAKRDRHVDLLNLIERLFIKKWFFKFINSVLAW